MLSSMLSSSFCWLHFMFSWPVTVRIETCDQENAWILMVQLCTYTILGLVCDRRDFMELIGINFWCMHMYIMHLWKKGNSCKVYLISVMLLLCNWSVICFAVIVPEHLCTSFPANFLQIQNGMNLLGSGKKVWMNMTRAVENLKMSRMWIIWMNCKGTWWSWLC